MNRYKVFHRTDYFYSSDIRLGPHALRLRPRAGHDLRIESSTIVIQPDAFLRWHRDVEDNCVAIATFHAPAKHLRIESHLVVEQYDHQPLDFLVEDYALRYPFAYSADDIPVLQAYLLNSSSPAEETLARWLPSIRQTGEEMESYVLLQRLNLAIHSCVSYRRREEPGVQSPNETLVRATGSCRDLAFLFMEAAKRLGFAARFVSGYGCTSQTSPDGGSTHAWAEVFLPGAGWKGFDPTWGEIVGVNHIPVAVGRLPHFVPPIAGSFSGKAELPFMDVTVSVERLDA